MEGISDPVLNGKPVEYWHIQTYLQPESDKAPGPLFDPGAKPCLYVLVRDRTSLDRWVL